MQIIYVYGMARSGTSAMTRLLSLCGLNLAEELIAPDTRINPSGFWEPKLALTLNERFLKAQHSDWHDPSFRIQEAGAISEKASENFIQEIVTFLTGQQHLSRLVIKEPRIVLLAKFWQEASRRLNATSNYVITIRNPAEVIESLGEGFALSPKISASLWLKSTLLAERATRMLPRVIVDYKNLMHDWFIEIDRVKSALSLNLDVSKKTEIEQFLDQKLYRQRRPPIYDGIFWNQEIRQAYDILHKAAEGGSIDMEGLDHIYNSFKHDIKLENFN